MAEALGLANLYLRSLYKGFQARRNFDDLDTYCMFIGYPRSGHSLVGSLLDAHPEMIFAHELGVLKYVHARFTKRQIYYLLLNNSRRFTERGRGRHFSYAVPGQWQGRYKKLRVIGDKHGEGASLRLRARPYLLDRLRKTIGLRIKFIHVVRNSYDNISTISNRQHMGLPDSIEYYFSLCETVSKTRKQIEKRDWFELKHESLIASPRVSLEHLCRFLGAQPADDYLSDCARIVYQVPHRSRYDVPWDAELINIVEKRMRQFSFLQGYSFED